MNSENSNNLQFPTNQVSILFARRDSVYKKLSTDVWDIDRDARHYDRGNPVVAHPPCRAWGKLRHFAKPRPGEKNLARKAVKIIREVGGVLEHPRASRLWEDQGLPMGKEIDQFGGFSISVDQHWWGHPARKTTLLYVCGCKPSQVPVIPLNFSIPTHHVTSCYRKGHPSYKPVLTPKRREETPIELAKWLIQLANLCSMEK